MKLCIFTEWYLPGTRGGGTVTALTNLVEAIRGAADVFIVTRNHDAGTTERYTGVKSDSWNQTQSSSVYYASSLTWGTIRQVLRTMSPDLIYVNSFFSPVTITLYLLRSLRMIGKCPLIIAPHGELHSGALRVKVFKKALFIHCALRLGLYRGVRWHATNSDEKKSILRETPKWLTATRIKDSDIFVAPNISSIPAWSPSVVTKVKGQCRLIYVGRISPKKNLNFAFRLLRELQGEILFEIYGPIEDPLYWAECKLNIRKLPPNVSVVWHGAIDPCGVNKIFARAHFFLFPTLGENYGYTIVESLSAGCPVITSAEVPWDNLADFRAGWKIELADETSWKTVLQQCVSMGQGDYDQMKAGARKFIETATDYDRAKNDTVTMFAQTLAAK